MNTTKKTIQLFFILALMTGGLWNLSSCKDDESDIVDKIDQLQKDLSDKIEVLSKTMSSITESLKTLSTKVDDLATKEDVKAVKDVVDQLTTALTQVSTTVSGLKSAISEDVKTQFVAQLTAIKTAMDAVQTALEKKIESTDGTIESDYQALSESLTTLKEELDKVEKDLESEGTTEQQHYEDILKLLQAKDMYGIDDVHFAYSLRANASIKDAFLFTDEDLENNELLAKLSLTKDKAAILIEKMHPKVLELSNLKVTDTDNMKITSLKAIEIFIGLESLDASNLKSLDEFHLDGSINTHLTSLNLSGDVLLDGKLNGEDTKDLIIENSKLIKLDVSKTNIKSLDISNNHVLAILKVQGCSNMESLDVSGTALTSLDISNTLNKLVTVKAKECNKLTTLNANRPDRTSGSIVNLDASNDQALVTLTANNNSALETLTLDNDNSLQTLEADYASFSSGLATLSNLGSNNALQTLKVSNTTNLEKIDVSKNHNLVTLVAENTSHSGMISSIVLPEIGNDIESSLETLNVSGNIINFIDLTSSQKLKNLDVSYNKLSGNTPEKDKEPEHITLNNGLDTHINPNLESLNVSNNPDILSLKLYNNKGLTNLNISSTKIATSVNNKLDLSMLTHFKSGATGGRLTKDPNQNQINF